MGLFLGLRIFTCLRGKCSFLFTTSVIGCLKSVLLMLLLVFPQDSTWMFFLIRTSRGRSDWNALPQLQQVRDNCPGYLTFLKNINVWMGLTMQTLRSSLFCQRIFILCKFCYSLPKNIHSLSFKAFVHWSSPRVAILLVHVLGILSRLTRSLENNV